MCNDNNNNNNTSSFLVLLTIRKGGGGVGWLFRDSILSHTFILTMNTASSELENGLNASHGRVAPLNFFFLTTFRSYTQQV